MRQKKPLSHQSNLRIFAANTCSNPLLEVGVEWQQFSSQSGLTASISCRHSKDVSDTEFQWMADLNEENMRDHYEKSENGWNKKQKEKEFRHETARILFVYQSPASAGDQVPEPIAFVHFRFEMDDEQKHPAVYCYEIMVKREFQSNGLGKHLMDVLYQIGYRFKMHKVMLTCFKHNTIALDWYNKLGYTPDVRSPEKCGMTASYQILCLRIRSK